MNSPLLLLNFFIASIYSKRGFEYNILCINKLFIKTPNRFRFLPTASIITHFLEAFYQSQLEQYVKDLNVLLKSRDEDIRFLLAMKIDNTFSKPTSVEGSFNPLYSNKACLPQSFSPNLNQNDLLIHLLVERVHHKGTQSKSPSSRTILGEPEGLERVTVGVLDFNAPDGFIFLPPWMFNTLNIEERDLVRVRKILLSDAVSVQLKPTSPSFLSMQDQQQFLEDRLKYYSNLTRGSTISVFDNRRNNVYNFNVVKIDIENKENVQAASIQDIDLPVDVLQPSSHLH